MKAAPRSARARMRALCGLALAALACGALAPPQALAEAERTVWSQLEGSHITQVVVPTPQGLEVRVQNPSSAPITVRWWLEQASNLEQSSPEVSVVPAQSESAVASLRVVNPSQAHRYRYRYRYAYGRPGAKPDGQPLALPFGPFRKVRVMQGPEGSFSHRGKQAYDFDLPMGAWILAARGGEVVRLHRSATTGGLGPSFLHELAVNSVLVAHDDGSYGYYAHFMPEGVAVAVGQRVAVGDRLGQAGATGYASGPHLHFEVDAAGPQAETMTHAVRFRTAQAPEGQALRGGEWVEAP